MPKPEATAAALEIYEAPVLAPYRQTDEAHGWATLNFCSALTSGNIDLIHEIVSDRDSGPGWQVLLDPQECPAAALPYLAQFVGARLTPAMSEAEQRAAIANPEGFGRGTPAAIVAVAKRRLTGTKTVLLVEFYTGLAYRMKLVTLESETPDPDATLADVLREQKPIGIRLFFNTSPDWDWDELEEEQATWDAVGEEFATWDAVVTHSP
jgi:hypothetical protein